MNQTSISPVRGLNGKPSAEEMAKLDRHWRPRYLLLAPHRLGFFLAMVVLAVAGVWWALVQLDRMSGVLGLPYALSPSLVHGAVMTFGFIPLFFRVFCSPPAPSGWGSNRMPLGVWRRPCCCRRPPGWCGWRRRTSARAWQLPRLHWPCQP